MKNIITMKSIFIFGLLIISTLDYVKAQTPYCSAAHSISCSSHNMHIGAVRIKEVATVIFDKAADGCNQTSAPNYTLMSTSPSFSLKEGCSYSMSFTTGNNSSVQVGVWIDLNRDNDFSDSGEFVSKGWDHINSGSSLQTRTFILHCGSVTAGNSRMRIRTDSAGSSRWNSGASCSTVKYGETEDYTIKLDTVTNPVAGFTMSDSFNIVVPVYFTNRNSNPCFSNQWDIEDNGTIEYTTVNPAHHFTTVGRHCLRLKTQNCKGPSIYDTCFNVNNPPTKSIYLNKDNTFHIYPNPSTGILNISQNILGSEILEIQVYNSIGELLKEIEIVPVSNGIQTIDLGKEVAGLYTLRISTKGKQISHKVSIGKSQ